MFMGELLHIDFQIQGWMRAISALLVPSLCVWLENTSIRKAIECGVHRLDIDSKLPSFATAQLAPVIFSALFRASLLSFKYPTNKCFVSYCVAKINLYPLV